MSKEKLEHDLLLAQQLLAGQNHPKPAPAPASAPKPMAFSYANVGTQAPSNQNMNYQGGTMSDGCCHNELNLERLCACCLRAKNLSALQITADDICSQTSEVATLSIQDGTANNLCVSGFLKASNISALSTNTNSLCATNATLTNACITNLTLGSNILPGTIYRATANFGTNQSYTLGAPLNFDNITDDPNNNIALAPFSYTAPMTGYYSVTFKVNVTGITQTTGPIVGATEAQLIVLVNGIQVRQALAPLISFVNSAEVILSSLITLQKGDVITLAYNVLTGTGIPLVGIASIVGSGIEDGNSLFKIILLSTLTSNSGPATPCTPCPTVTIPCMTNITPCQPILQQPCGPRSMIPEPCDGCE